VENRIVFMQWIHPCQCLNFCKHSGFKNFFFSPAPGKKQGPLQVKKEDEKVVRKRLKIGPENH
jgi:hypothetical protein